MKIEIKDGGHELNISVPDGLVYGRLTLWLGRKFGRKYAGEMMDRISAEAMETLLAELKRIKKKHGSWDLVEVMGSDGEVVRVIL